MLNTIGVVDDNLTLKKKTTNSRRKYKCKIFTNQMIKSKGKSKR